MNSAASAPSDLSSAALSAPPVTTTWASCVLFVPLRESVPAPAFTSRSSPVRRPSYVVPTLWLTVSVAGAVVVTMRLPVLVMTPL
ncbi:MAG: hypothetical protein BWX70_03045 [Verrucomicrobia bacterium ADurb.Bin070]|nr:MAG: hypothetical protein BWX70_03045 [Verrucomicrobia bacterium ADurb.Bin070]